MSVSWATSSPEELRLHHARDAVERAGALPGDVAEAEVPERGGFRGGLLFTPPGLTGRDVIVYFHGGGFVAGSPETHRCVTAWLAQLSGMRVLSARYGLAPEHPFPAQREDAVAAVGAALALGDAAAGGGVLLAGDSAGACVALWGLDGLPPRERAGVRGLLLLYGGFGLVDSESVARYGTAENGLDSNTLAVMYGRLRRAGGEGASIVWPPDFATPIAEPAYVLAAERDAVFDDSVRLFQSLRPSALDNRFVVALGQEHGFLKGAGRDPAALQELAKAASWAAERARATVG